jgi:hypothetical protein
MEPFPVNTDILLDGKSFQLWPNPVRDFLYLTVPDVSSEQTIRITDLVGKEVYNQNINDIHLSIDVKNFPPGVYILRLNSIKMQITRIFIKG